MTRWRSGSAVNPPHRGRRPPPRTSRYPRSTMPRMSPRRGGWLRPVVAVPLVLILVVLGCALGGTSVHDPTHDVAQPHHAVAALTPAAAVPDPAMPDPAMPDPAMPDPAMPDDAMPGLAMTQTLASELVRVGSAASGHDRPTPPSGSCCATDGACCLAALPAPRQLSVLLVLAAVIVAVVGPLLPRTRATSPSARARSQPPPDLAVLCVLRT